MYCDILSAFIIVVVESFTYINRKLHVHQQGWLSSYLKPRKVSPITNRDYGVVD